MGHCQKEKVIIIDRKIINLRIIKRGTKIISWLIDLLMEFYSLFKCYNPFNPNNTLNITDKKDPLKNIRWVV
jgi:hypothetical protein